MCAKEKITHTHLRVALGAERAGLEQRLLVVNAPLVHVQTRLGRGIGVGSNGMADAEIDR